MSAIHVSVPQDSRIFEVSDPYRVSFLPLLELCSRCDP